MTEKKTNREKLIEAAMTALIEGNGEFEMGDVARKAGVSGGLAYHYFGSKAGLLSAVIGDFYDRYDAVANQRFDPALPWVESERKRLQVCLRFLYDDPVAPIVLGRMGGTAEVIAVEAARQNAMIDLAVKNIEKAQAAGDVPLSVDAGIAAAAIIGGIRQAAMRALTAEPRPDPAELADQLWHFTAGAFRLEAVAL